MNFFVSRLVYGHLAPFAEIRQPDRGWCVPGDEPLPFPSVAAPAQVEVPRAYSRVLHEGSTDVGFANPLARPAGEDPSSGAGCRGIPLE